MMTGLTPAPEGHSIALTVSSAGVATGRGGGDESPSGNYIINVESGQLTRVPPAPPQPGAQPAGRGGRGGARIRRRQQHGVRAGRPHPVLPIRHRPVRGNRAAGGPARWEWHRPWRGPRRWGGGTAAAPPETGATNATARQVSYTANIQVDRRQLRSQVFNEGWRIMKHRFYDAKMHGADWNATKKHVRAAARVPRRHRGAPERHDDDDRPPQRVPHRRQRRRAESRAHAADAVSGLRSRRGRVRLLQGRPRLQRWPCRSRSSEDRDRPLRHPDRRSRAEDGRQLLAAPHAGRRQQVPLPAQRQADQGRRLDRHASIRLPAPRSPISSTPAGWTIAARWSPS